MAITITVAPLDVPIFKFGVGESDGSSAMKDTLGGKGANLAEMATLGIPVPAGFTIPTQVSVKFSGYESHPSKMKALMPALEKALDKGMDYLGADRLVSVRSGARVSMPGMMDTILNVGITSENLPKWKDLLGPRTALDSFRRFLQMYGSVALGIPMQQFEDVLSSIKSDVDVVLDSELSALSLERVVDAYALVYKSNGFSFPETVKEQLLTATCAVFKSWNNPRAIEYRKINGIPDTWGTAVTVQSMVFGNLGDDSCTGVVFSRDPSTGIHIVTGEYLVNAQGEDVVAGIRTPDKISTLFKWNPAVSVQLFEVLNKLESHYRDMQDVEFTVEKGKLFILQTRNAKRSAKAAFCCAYDMVNGGMITVPDLPGRITKEQLRAVLVDTIDPSFTVPPDAVGIPAGGSIVSGVAVFSSEDAVNCTEPCILIRHETDPDDIAGINAAVGILTATGGLTSHAAVVARGMNKTCVVGVTSLCGGSNGKVKITGGPNIHAGVPVVIDGHTGNVWVNVTVPVIKADASLEVKKVCLWMSGESCDVLKMDLVPSPVDALGKSLAGWSQAYLTTTLLRTKEGVETTITSLYHVLKERKDLMVTLDVSQFIPAVDESYYTMFATPTLTYEAVIASLQGWKGNNVRNRVNLVGVQSGTPKIDGFIYQSRVNTFADLLKGGYLPPTKSVIDNVFGGEDYFQSAASLVQEKFGVTLGIEEPVPKFWYESIEKELQCQSASL